MNNPGISASFPTDNSKASKLARMQTAIVTLQNLRGPGVGCPAASTTFLAQQKAIQDGAENTPSPAPAPAPAPAPPAAGGVDPALVPEFGHQAGLNPTGTGDCDGAVKNAAGETVKIPCSCPPDRDSFLAVRAFLFLAHSRAAVETIHRLIPPSSDIVAQCKRSCRTRRQQPRSRGFVPYRQLQSVQGGADNCCPYHTPELEGPRSRMPGGIHHPARE